MYFRLTRILREERKRKERERERERKTERERVPLKFAQRFRRAAAKLASRSPEATARRRRCAESCGNKCPRQLGLRAARVWRISAELAGRNIKQFVWTPISIDRDG